MSDLGFRARKILFSTITEYIATGEPVGSRTLARHFGLNLSPASIRNVLADLEEAGFLAQPHTSAGRVPTEKGFRAFVEALAAQHEVSAEDRSAIEAKLRSLRPGVDDVSRETGKLLAAMAGAAAVVMPPRPEEELLTQLRFIPMREGELLAVVVTRTGGIQNRIVRVERKLEPGELDRVHNYLAELIADRTLAQIRDVVAGETSSERGHYDQLKRRAKEMLDAAVASPEPPKDVLIEGQRILLDRPEFSQIERIRDVLHALEEKERILELLDRTIASGGVQVVIGHETQLGADGLSMVSAAFHQAGSASGSIGVIGPTRMDYAKVVPLVGFTARTVSELFDSEDREPND